ncbi:MULTISPECIES: 3'-5' exonuclease [Alphaproteobacteria]|uniref:DNA-directed DNA polymerase n=2 Tax=Alphaproteobacteria TaxID=28211 RepID=A0A512HL17_9HYPH|nr:MULTISPECIES: exonuclease domain-containing protein [Alphaproteobacteria]GEO86148.1 DNA polymerase III subunit epsilon [Ciceribacter naphthalenivorans]GLR22715.1 DNA polymerase III subunit epsilon [Ciceribacter naphthalenivorans]GLT05571.1 DNA polymerase III subunit epsilon [Sphingomonas psychrolutea]
MTIGLRGRVLLFFVAIALGAIVALGLGLWFGYHRHGSPEMLDAFIQGAVASSFGILALVAWIWFLFDTHVSRPIEQLASAMRVRTHADVAGDIDPSQARYLGDLAEAASSATASLAQSRNSLVEAVARETARLSSDKTKLEHLLSDVPPAVLLCTGRHHIVFYNSVAQHLLSGPKTPVCLGRNLFDYVNDGAIRQVHHRLLEAALPDAVVEFVCTSPCGSRRLAGRMRLARDNGGDAGAYVMTLRDVTAEVAAYARRDVLLCEVFEHVRPTVAALVVRIGGDESQDGSPSMSGLKDDVEKLDATLADLATRFDGCRADGWPMAPVDLRELAVNLQRLLASSGIPLEIEASALALRCNAFDIVSLLGHVARKAASAGDVNGFNLRIREMNEAAEIRLGWQGRAVSDSDLKQWLSDPVDGSPGGLPAEAILAAHAATIVPDREGSLASISMSLRPIQHLKPAPTDTARSVVYDFDLLSRVYSERIAEARLDDLTYVVFDTETTGLFPERGDEIVQIAAVRIVNGRRVPGEAFDMLVNPGRPIPRSSSAIHGVTDAMVADALSVQEAVERFHTFAKGAVIVAHNAPFDMAFLQRRETELGIRFVNPILDTVLMSAAVFGLNEKHTLDDLVDRLGVDLPESQRHTAMGDTLGTAEVFLKLKQVFQARGIERLSEALAEVKRYDRLLQDINQTTEDADTA